MSISSYDLKQIWFTAVERQKLKHIQKILEIEPSLINAYDSKGKDAIGLMMKGNDNDSYRTGYSAAYALSAPVDKITIDVKKSVREMVLECLFTFKSKTNVPYIETSSEGLMEIKLISDDEMKYLLFLALRFSRIEQVKAMVKNHPLLINAQNNKGTSVSMDVFFSHTRELFKMLGKSSVLDLSIKDNLGYDTFFYLARMMPYKVHLKYNNVYEIIKKTFEFYQALNKNLYKLFGFCIDGDFYPILWAYNHVGIREQSYPRESLFQYGEEVLRLRE